MDVVCTVNFYPVRQEQLSPAIDAFWTALEDFDVDVERTELHTAISGEQDEVFRALEAAWDAALDVGPGALEVTVKEDRDRDVPGWEMDG